MIDRRTVLAGAAGGVAASVLPATAFGSSGGTNASASGHWDRVPLYGHLGKNTDDFTEQEVEFLVRYYPVVAIEKAQGIRKHGSTEAGSAAAHRAIKAVSPDTRTLFYWNGFIDYGKLYAASADGLPDDYYLRTLAGQIDESRPGAPRYDLSNPKMRQWWIDVAMRELDRVGYDGVFVDALPQVAARPEAGVRRLGADKQRAIEEGSMILLADLRARMGEERALVYNGIRSLSPGWSDGGMRYLKHADTTMLEHFGFLESGKPERMAADMDLIARSDAMGRKAVFKAWPNFSFLDKEMMKRPVEELARSAREQITFPLAAFLCCAGPNSYFHYSWGYREDHGQLEHFPEFDRPLGPPAGPAMRTGYRYERNFAHAAVSVDLEIKTGRIDWA